VFRAGHAVVSAGPWLNALLPELGLPLVVERQVMTWFPARDPAAFVPERFPAFIRERDGVHSYGLPSQDGRLVKVAIHHQGRPMDPDAPGRDVIDADRSAVAAIVAETLPGLESWPERAAVCLYTNTPDLHFVVGRVHPRVTVLGGFSGHGFKFAPVMGEIAADLALDGGTGHPIAGFSPDRFAAI
jgi:sarcosine oxidase